MKKLMGIETNDCSKMQGLANNVADGNCEILANSMNDFFVSVSERLNVDNELFTVEGELPDECIISTRQVTRVTHVRNRVCPLVELILKNHNYIANYITRIY